MDEKMMKAVTFVDKGKLEMREYPIPVPQYGQVLVKILASAICTVDQRAYRGITKNKFPVVQGHEAVGRIVEIAEGVHNFAVGDYVVIGRDQCNFCRYCRKGINFCENRGAGNRKYLNAGPNELKAKIGYMAEYTLKDPANLTKVSDDIPPEWAALTEPISCVVHSITRSRLKAGETCVIIGAGIMGLLHTQIAKDLGAKVIISEPDAKRRERAIQCGADVVIDPTQEDPVEAVRRSNGGYGADVVIFAIGVNSAFPQSLSMLDHGGRIVLYSSQHPDDPVGVQIGSLHSNEYEIIGTVGSMANDYSRAVELLNAKKLKMDLVIDHVVPFDNFQEAFDKAIVPGTYRVVMKMK